MAAWRYTPPNTPIKRIYDPNDVFDYLSNSNLCLTCKNILNALQHRKFKNNIVLLHTPGLHMQNELQDWF